MKNPILDIKTSPVYNKRSFLGGTFERRAWLAGIGHERVDYARPNLKSDYIGFRIVRSK